MKIVGLMNEIHIPTHLVKSELVAQDDETDPLVIGGSAIKVGGIQSLEMLIVTIPQKVESDEAVLPIRGSAHVGRVAKAKGERVLLFLVGIGKGGTQLEAVEVAPILGIVIDINRRGVVLETAHWQGLFAETHMPARVELVLQIEEVCVVKQADAPRVGDDTLPEEEGEVMPQVTAQQQVEILAIEAELMVYSRFQRDLVILMEEIVEVGTGLQ